MIDVTINPSGHIDDIRREYNAVLNRTTWWVYYTAEVDIDDMGAHDTVIGFVLEEGRYWPLPTVFVRDGDTISLRSFGHDASGAVVSGYVAGYSDGESQEQRSNVDVGLRLVVIEGNGASKSATPSFSTYRELADHYGLK